ncbi:cytochrome P450 [Actinokineospora sp. NBRC 105648]|uniref:cytochrome P450 n=1 Tax=Actinokineospora sp. NBRC 105648 TaxID=3032206 RepID=UPI0024A34EEC|nr:cytochrome P450 [Actinokineospora sp. NBRC 105648]GLZ36519.1 cytochrome P450 [Actinokineospora sp. NBRC 105648]
MSHDLPEGITPVQLAVIESVAPNWRHDPYRSYDVLRAAGPFVPGPMDTQLVPRYREADLIMQNPDWSHAEESELLHPDSEVELPGSFLWMEPPDHTRLRGLVSKAFTVRTVENLRGRTEQVVADLMDKMLAQGSDGTVDLLEALAYPLPLTMVCELLGVPAEAHEHVRQMSSGIARGLDPDLLLSPEELAARTKAVHQFTEFFTELLAQRRKQPADDLITRLVQAEAEGARMSPTELLGTLLILVVAGHETTVNLIGNGVLALIRNPDQFAALKADPDLAAPAADEVLRYDAPVHLTTRTARKEITVSGRTFAPGESVIVLFGSANRDPEAFVDADRLDLTRYAAGKRANRHLSFGLGLHYCIGAPLARLEMETALRAIATRVSAFELPQDPPPYRPNLVVRGMSELHVRVVPQEQSR